METAKSEQKGTGSVIYLLDSAGGKEGKTFWAMIHTDRTSPFHRMVTVQVAFRVQKILFPILLSLIAILIAGCTNAKPTLGAISVTDPSGAVKGQVNSVIVGGSVDVSVAVSNDTPALGVDWSLLCGGSAVPGFTANVCGTITPVHVGSNINMVYLAPAYIPVSNTVTLTATSTVDPSESTSAVLTILPQPITIQFTQGFLPPASLGAGESAQVAATVTNDPTAAGVTWSVTCGGASCGSFNPILSPSGNDTTTYTAPAAIPAGGTVTVIATSVADNTKSVSAIVQIMPISVATTISPNQVPWGTTATLTTTVSWDSTGAGVTWSAPSCAATGCGVINPGSCTVGGVGATTTTVCTATYTPPTSYSGVSTTLPVTVTAVSITDSTKSGTVNFTVQPPPPISVSVTANPSSVQVEGTANLSATVSYDFANSGVNWQCSPACSPAVSTIPTSTTGTTATYSTTYTPVGPLPSGDASIPAVVTATSIAAASSDPTGSASTTLTVFQPITVNLSTQPVTAGVPATFTATVSNEIAAGGVDWTASGCPSTNCGTFNSGNPAAPSHSASGASITYTAPNNIPWPASNATVTITATSTASETVPPVSSASAQVAVTPVTYGYFIPFAPSTLPVGNPTSSSPTLISVAGAAANDSTNQGVDWTVTCSDASTAACGQFLKKVEMVATATTADVPASFWPYAAKVHAASGQALVYEPPTQVPTGGTVTLTVASTANPSASSTQVITITSSLNGPALSGKVQVGSLPVSGASVQLVAAGNTGYGSASTLLVISNGGNNVTTGSDGSFTIAGSYTCPSLNSLLYLVATGGQPGGPQRPTNNQLGLMTAIGPCSNLNSSVSLMVNEVTTVASAYALAPFTAADYAHIGSSSKDYNNGPNPTNATNYNNGLASAFATVNNLVNITLGTAISVTPAGNGTAPQAEINTIADAINTCAASGGGAPGDGSACDAFFQASNVNPPLGGASTAANAPTSILQAVLELAKVPSTNRLTEAISGTPLYSLVPSCPTSCPPFVPDLTAAPYDWSLAISYTGGGLEGKKSARANSSAMAIDASGDVWISNSFISSVTELSAQGAPLSPFATGTTRATGGGFKGGGLSSPQEIAIDPYGDAWVLNAGGSLSELDPTGAPLSPAPTTFSGGGNPADTGQGIAIDGTGNVWVAETGTPGDVAEYAGYNGGVVNGAPVTTGTPLSPPGVGFVGSVPNEANAIDSPNGAISIDGSGDVWTLNQGNYAAVELSGVNGQLLDVDQGDTIDPQSSNPFNPPQYLLSSEAFGVSMAIGNAGDIYIPNNNTSSQTQIYELLAGGSSSNFGGVGQQINPPIAPVYAPVVLDGAGDLWLVAQAVPEGTTTVPISIAELSSSGASLNLNGLAPGFISPSVSASGPTSIAADASGNVWVLSGASPSIVTEFVGVAVPVVTPVSVGVQKNKLGKTP